MTHPGQIKKAFIVILLATSFVALSINGLAQTPEPGRISDVEGKIQTKGGYDDDWVKVGKNVAVGAGDRLWLMQRGLAEIEFPGGALVRLQGEAKLDIVTIDLVEDGFEISLTAYLGGFYIRTPPVQYNNETTTISIKSFAGIAMIQPDSLVRLDLSSDWSRLRVMEGSAKIKPSGLQADSGKRSFILKAQEQIILKQDSKRLQPETFSVALDDTLDRYNRDREYTLAEDTASEYLERPLIGQKDLDRHGHWVMIGGRDYWRPHVPQGWRPYSVGYWAWYRPYGRLWVSHDPFGYVTFHYGSWSHDPFYGWLWYPGYVWKPAHVHWIVVGPYYAWAPLGPRGHPVTTGRIHFSLHNGFGIDLNVWSYAPVTYFSPRHHPLHKHQRRFKPLERRFFINHSAKSITSTRVGRSFIRPTNNPKWIVPSKTRSTLRGDRINKSTQRQLQNVPVNKKIFKNKETQQALNSKTHVLTSNPNKKRSISQKRIHARAKIRSEHQKRHVQNVIPLTGQTHKQIGQNPGMVAQQPKTFQQGHIGRHHRNPPVKALRRMR